MIRILQINSCVAMYSTGRIVEEIGNAIISEGWESYVGYGRAARKSSSQVIKIGTDWDIRMHGIKTRLFDGQGLGSKRATEVFVEEVKKLSPDLIHIHNIHDYYINYPVLFRFLQSSNIPVVWTFHDLWPVTGHCAHFSMIGCEKWKTECYQCPQKKVYPASIFLDRSRQNFALKKELFRSLKNIVVVPVSTWLGSMLNFSFLSGSNIRVINNGIDIDRFRPTGDSKATKEKYKIGDRTMLLAVATAWSLNKGLYDYFTLSNLLNEDEVIVLVGLTKEQLRELPEKIIGIERTEDFTELVALYTSADIVLNLSFEETFGLTTVEGMACGTPGIVYNCTASPELISPETGFVVEAGDMKGIINAISAIKEKGKSYYSKACRERVLQYYNKEDRYKDYIALYKELLKNT